MLTVISAMNRGEEDVNSLENMKINDANWEVITKRRKSNININSKEKKNKNKNWIEQNFGDFFFCNSNAKRFKYNEHELSYSPVTNIPYADYWYTSYAHTVLYSKCMRTWAKCYFFVVVVLFICFFFLFFSIFPSFFLLLLLFFVHNLLNSWA